MELFSKSAFRVHVYSSLFTYLSFYGGMQKGRETSILTSLSNRGFLLNSLGTDHMPLKLRCFMLQKYKKINSHIGGSMHDAAVSIFLMQCVQGFNGPKLDI